MDNPFFIKDNSSKNIGDLTNSEKEVFNTIANKNIKTLLKENENLIVYSNNNSDKIEDQVIFKLNSSYQLETGNLVGFIGLNDIRINIGSRFSEDHSRQYFIQYMLQKIHKLTLFDLNSNSDNNKIWEELLYFLFPVFLKKAFVQGLFKVYQEKSYNDSNIKGRVDIARHIKKNVPFIGDIAYSNKELSYNNLITHLIRHSIEFISFKGYKSIFQNDFLLNQAVQTIKTITPDYSINQRQRLILKNYKRVNHPFFTEYEFLRKICVQILNYDGISFNNNHNKIYGLIIDAAWLWEEYLNSILFELGFEHPDNKNRIGGINLFLNSQKLYPDFYNNKTSVVIDAKYKRLKDENNLNREDIYQVITYMYRLKSKHGVLLYPVNFDNIKPEKMKMNLESYGGSDSQFIKYGLKIPTEKLEYEKYRMNFKESEIGLQNYFKSEVFKQC